MVVRHPFFLDAHLGNIVEQHWSPYVLYTHFLWHHVAEMMMNEPQSGTTTFGITEKRCLVINTHIGQASGDKARTQLRPDRKHRHLTRTVTVSMKILRVSPAPGRSKSSSDQGQQRTRHPATNCKQRRMPSAGYPPLNPSNSQLTYLKRFYKMQLLLPAFPFAFESSTHLGKFRPLFPVGGGVLVPTIVVQPLFLLIGQRYRLLPLLLRANELQFVLKLSQSPANLPKRGTNRNETEKKGFPQVGRGIYDIRDRLGWGKTQQQSLS